jgi:hypothetical protein
MTDQEATGGRVVPAYALTHGRTRSAEGGDLPLEALVTVTDLGRQRSAALRAERRTIVELCAGPVSVAELASYLHVPVGVARVLVSDLVSSGHLAVQLPRHGPDQRPDPVTLERLLDGLRGRR